jgi:hypothetical protein
MQTVSVVALKSFDLEGRPVHAGEAVDLAPVQAAIRARSGEVSLDPRYPVTYRTKEIRSEAPPAPVPAATTHAKTRRPRRRRTTTA